MASETSDRIVEGPEAMAAAGAGLARELIPGDLVLVRGEVGAGKSTLIRAVLRELGVEGAIPSPTYTIGRLYRGRDGTPLAHLDLHRLGAAAEEDPGLLDEYFGPDRITLVEWPEGKGELLPAGEGRRFEVDIRHRDETSRLVAVAGPVPNR